MINAFPAKKFSKRLNEGKELRSWENKIDRRRRKNPKKTSVKSESEEGK